MAFGRIYARQDRADEAITVFSKLIGLWPQQARFYYALRAQLYERKGDKEKATDDRATAKRLGYKEGEPFPPLTLVDDGKE
jgi:tetratricopeptide (TPR) repeat protein